MPQLTDTENSILELLRESIDTRGFVPSVREICTQLQIKSTSTVHRCLASLQEKGLIYKKNNLNRAIQLAGPRMTRVPLLGLITAGQPVLAQQEVESYLPYDGDPREVFALRVRGDSMINVGILNGDLIFVRRCASAENGTIVVALIDDEATVKRFFKEAGGYRLQPENDTMPPILVDQVTILGRVIELRRQLG